MCFYLHVGFFLCLCASLHSCLHFLFLLGQQSYWIYDVILTNYIDKDLIFKESYTDEYLGLGFHLIFWGYGTQFNTQQGSFWRF